MIRFVNIDGVYAIQDWIDSNQDMNPTVFDLWAGGIASCINRATTLEQELADNGYFSYETGLRDGQGHPLIIKLYPEHFDSEAVA